MESETTRDPVDHSGIINPNPEIAELIQKVEIPRPDIDEAFEHARFLVRKWLSQIYGEGKAERAINAIDDDRIIRAKIWTATNEYSIVASFDEKYGYKRDDCFKGYLGCVSSCRKSRTGEDWFRGNDLADGRFSEETWRKILFDIVAYEAENVKSTEWKKRYNMQKNNKGFSY